MRREDFPIVDGLVKKITTEARGTRRNTRKNLVKLCALCAYVVKKLATIDTVEHIVFLFLMCSMCLCGEKINHNRHSRTHSFSFPIVPYVPMW